MRVDPGQESPYGLESRQRQAWDGIARSIPDLLPAYSTRYYRRCEIALIQRFIGDLRGKRVLKLDLWNEAVNTRLLQWMASQGANAHGLDLSAVTVSRAQKNIHLNGNSVRLVQSDIRAIPFHNGTFDFVYTMGTIEHIEQYRKAVREICRVLRPGGRAVIGVPHKWNIFLRPLLVTVLDWFDKYPYSPEKSFSARELREVVEDSGLKVKDRTGLLTLPGIVRMGELFLMRRNIPLYKLSPWLIRPFEYLETRWKWPGRFGYLMALVVEK